MASYRLLLWPISITTLCVLSVAQKYILIQQLKTVDEAESYCQQYYGTSLASIHSYSDNIEANQLCISDSNCLNGVNCKAACSIGANDKQNERYSNHDGWVWNDETPFNYWNWADGEPNQWHLFPNQEDCAIIWANNHPYHAFPGTWNDCPCDGSGNYVQRFLCNAPTLEPTNHPISTQNPSKTPTTKPTEIPTKTPTQNPTKPPTTNPTKDPTKNPTINPTKGPTKNPTVNPTINPTKGPTRNPTRNPTINPTINPTKNSATNPIRAPIDGPTYTVTSNPTLYPTEIPTIHPIFNVTESPTQSKLVSSADIDSAIITTETELESNKYIKYKEHSHEHVYIIGGLIGGLVFLCLCVCCLLAVGLIYCWRRKRNVNDARNRENIGMASIVHHHHYHGSTGLTEHDDNTIKSEHNGEGDDGNGRVELGLNAEKENIHLLPPDMVFSDDDEELDGMYIQSIDTKKGGSDDNDDVNRLLDVEENQNIIPGDDIHTS